MPAIKIVILCSVIFGFLVFCLESPYGELPTSTCSLQNITIDQESDEFHSENINISGTFLTYPNYLIVQRCAGGCGSTGIENELYSCSPDQVVNRSVNQIIHAIGQLKWRVVKVSEHLSCKCPCTGNPTGQCPLATQKFIPDRCRCECTNVDEQRQCPLKRFTWGAMFWDETRCECRCPQFYSSYVRLTPDSPPVCSKIYEFDHQQCRCIPKFKSPKSPRIRTTKRGQKRV